MKNLQKDTSTAALIIFAIVLFISGEYTVSTALFAIAIIALNIKSSFSRFKAGQLSLG
jgi:hypothetical protein